MWTQVGGPSILAHPPSTSEENQIFLVVRSGSSCSRKHGDMHMAPHSCPLPTHMFASPSNKSSHPACPPGLLSYGTARMVSGRGLHYLVALLQRILSPSPFSSRRLDNAHANSSFEKGAFESSSAQSFSVNVQRSLRDRGEERDTHRATASQHSSSGSMLEAAWRCLSRHLHCSRAI